MSHDRLDIQFGQTETLIMGTPPSRDVFPLRFKNRATREALRNLAQQTGVSMTDIAERAIEHEITLQGADLERRLAEALVLVRSYRPQHDAEAYITAVAAGESSGMDPFRDMRAAHDTQGDVRRPAALADPLGVLAAFKR